MAPIPAAAAPLTPEALQALLMGLAHALEYDLGAAETLLGELRAGVAGTSLEKPVAALAERIDVFDIDAAQQQLKKLEIPSPDTTP